MIIDSHTHLGASSVSDNNYMEETWLETMKKYGLDGIMSYPTPQAAPGFKEAHDRIHTFSQAHPGKIWGVVDLNPNLPEDVYAFEAERCVKKLGFVAIKLHPYMHGCIPGSKHVVKVYETARRLGVPLIVHTGLGAPSALPSAMLPIALQYKDLPIVLAHAGAYIYTAEAVAVAQVCDNIYLEPSWCAALRIKEMFHKVGLDRVMFGSDVPTNVPVELAKVEGGKLTDKEREQYLGGNALRFYKLH